ncbi:MAG: hypothetical protein HZR80_09200 [Candidatus Heimdallarchaeota archaeon]
MEEKTQLEEACYIVIGEKYNEYYSLLSKLLILNPGIIKNNDPRFLAQFTMVLFDDEIKDKSHIICELIDYMDMNKVDKKNELNIARKLLDLDPVLNKTNKIITTLKKLPDPDYSKLMKKVAIKYQTQLYYNMEGYGKRRI